MFKLIIKNSEDLQTKIASIKADKSNHAKKIVCLVDDPSFAVINFDYPKDKISDIHEFISAKAAESLNMPVSSLLVTRFIQKQETSLNGFYCAVSKKLMDKIMDVFLKSGIVPAVVSSYRWWRLNTLRHLYSARLDSVVVVDHLNDNHYQICILAAGECVLWRFVDIDSLEELKQEISTSLLRASSHPQCKTIQFAFLHTLDAKSKIDPLNKLFKGALNFAPADPINEDSLPQADWDQMNFCLEYLPKEKIKRIVYNVILGSMVVVSLLLAFQVFTGVKNYLQQQSLIEILNRS